MKFNSLVVLALAAAGNAGKGVFASAAQGSVSSEEERRKSEVLSSSSSDVLFLNDIHKETQSVHGNASKEKHPRRQKLKNGQRAAPSRSGTRSRFSFSTAGALANKNLPIQENKTDKELADVGHLHPKNRFPSPQDHHDTESSSTERFSFSAAGSLSNNKNRLGGRKEGQPVGDSSVLPNHEDNDDNSKVAQSDSGYVGILSGASVKSPLRPARPPQETPGSSAADRQLIVLPGNAGTGSCGAAYTTPCDGPFGTAGMNSCNGNRACLNLFNGTTVGDGSCNYIEACQRADASIDDMSCNAPEACEDFMARLVLEVVTTPMHVTAFITATIPMI